MTFDKRVEKYKTKYNLECQKTDAKKSVLNLLFYWSIGGKVAIAGCSAPPATPCIGNYTHSEQNLFSVILNFY
jgi:hypothetical protein